MLCFLEQVVFSANRGSGVKDEIAIDDISFSQGCGGFGKPFSGIKFSIFNSFFISHAEWFKFVLFCFVSPVFFSLLSMME